MRVEGHRAARSAAGAASQEYANHKCLDETKLELKTRCAERGGQNTSGLCELSTPPNVCGKTSSLVCAHGRSEVWNMGRWGPTHFCSGAHAPMRDVRSRTPRARAPPGRRLRAPHEAHARSPHAPRREGRAAPSGAPWGAGVLCRARVRVGAATPPTASAAAAAACAARAAAAPAGCRRLRVNLRLLGGRAGRARALVRRFAPTLDLGLRPSVGNAQIQI